MAQVFVSYATEDRLRVQPLVALLEAEGLTVWWDRRIETGSSWDKVIERELDAAACVVVVWSARSVSSDWVRSEATEAADRGVLVPILIDEVRLPLAFRRMQTAMLIGWPAQEARDHTRDLVATISQLVGARPVEAKPDTAPAAQIVIAVMPLADRTAEANMAYLCEGIAEDLMNAFFPVEGLRVLSAMDTFALKHTHMVTSEIGAALGATVVLEGSVQRAGQQIAVAARLVEVATGHTIYSQRFLRDVNDAFALQAELAENVVGGLRRHLGLKGQTQPAFDSSPRDQTAFELYANFSTLPNEIDARVRFRELYQIALLECVIAADPKFSQAYVDLALLYWHMSQIVPHRGARAKVILLLEQLELHSPGSPFAWDIQVEMEGDMAALERRGREAIERGHRVHAYPHPTGLHDVRAGYATALAHSGLPREALRYFELLDRNGEPNRAFDWLHQGGCLVALGDYAAAIELARKHRAIYPGDGLVDLWQTVAQLALGDIQGLETIHTQLDSWSNAFIAPVMRWKRSEANHLDGTRLLGDANDEMRAFALLAMGEVQAGLDALEQVVRNWGPDIAHWIALRLTVFQRLFGAEVKQHPRYRKLLTELHLDDASRERMRANVATLTPITGVEIAPLLVL